MTSGVWSALPTASRQTIRANDMEMTHVPGIPGGEWGDHGPRRGSRPSLDARTETFDDCRERSGHSHHYERFNGMGHISGTNQGNPTCDARGPREFIVGTGGIGLNTAFATILNCDAFHSTAYFGALKLTLHSQQYDFQFVDTGGAVRDAASGIGTL